MHKFLFRNLVFIFFLILFPLSASWSPATAYWLLDKSGAMVEITSQVLGLDSESSLRDVASQNKVLEQVSDADRQALEKQKEAAQKKLELDKAARIKALETRKESTKSKLESSGTKLKVRQEVLDREGKALRHTDRELEVGESLHLENTEGPDTLVTPVEDGGIELRGQKVRTRTHFPITIGTGNTLIITKKDGTEKVVTTLPDAAVANLAAKGFAVTLPETELVESADGTPVYNFEVHQTKKLFGIFRNTFTKNAVVSAETGEIVELSSGETSPFQKFLDRFSY